jgi:hypothetical protein
VKRNAPTAPQLTSPNVSGDRKPFSQLEGMSDWSAIGVDLEMFSIGFPFIHFDPSLCLLVCHIRVLSCLALDIIGAIGTDYR